MLYYIDVEDDSTERDPSPMMRLHMTDVSIARWESGDEGYSLRDLYDVDVLYSIATDDWRLKPEGDVTFTSWVDDGEGVGCVEQITVTPDFASRRVFPRHIMHDARAAWDESLHDSYPNEGAWFAVNYGGELMPKWYESPADMAQDATDCVNDFIGFVEFVESEDGEGVLDYTAGTTRLVRRF